MNLAATPFCFWGFDPWVAYRHFARVGIHHVEVPAFPARQSLAWGLSTFAPEMLAPEDVDALRTRLATLDLTPVTVAAMGDVLDPRQRAPLGRRLEFAAALGCSVVLMDAGPLPPIATAERGAAVANARELARWAADLDLRIGLEIHDGATRTGALARVLLDEVDHPALGVNYDTANVIYYNGDVDPAEDLRTIVDRVVHVHLKDTTGGLHEWQFCALGDGRVDFSAVLEVLRAAGFDGTYSLEIEGVEGEDLNRAGHLARLERSVAYLRRVGVIA